MNTYGRLLRILTLIGLLLPGLPVQAALEPGTPAPAIRTTGALGGQRFDFELADALKQGAVVLYFFPAAFTPGCTVEAHEFAEASDEFAALGARVVGVSTDDIETLQRFSVSECRSKFAVLSDEDGAITRDYDAVLRPGSNYAARISYVIAPDGEILFVHEGPKPGPHIRETLQAVRNWRQQHGAAGAE